MQCLKWTKFKLDKGFGNSDRTACEKCGFSITQDKAEKIEKEILQPFQEYRMRFDKFLPK